MSLNQKYTWNDFLNDNPEFKERKVKRTSAEGRKAFETAFKAKIKDVLKDRLAWIEKEQGRVGKVKDSLVQEIKTAKKPQRRVIQSRIGEKESYLSRLDKISTRTKQVQKSY